MTTPPRNSLDVPPPTYEVVQLHGGPWAGQTLAPPGEHEVFAFGAIINVDPGHYTVDGPAGPPLPPEYGRATFNTTGAREA